MFYVCSTARHGLHFEGHSLHLGIQIKLFQFIVSFEVYSALCAFESITVCGFWIAVVVVYSDSSRFSNNNGGF